MTDKLIKQPDLKPDISHLRHGPAVMYIFIGFKEGAPEFPKRNYWCFNTNNYDSSEDWKTFSSRDTQDFIEGNTSLMFVSFPSEKDSDYRYQKPNTFWRPFPFDIELNPCLAIDIPAKVKRASLSHPVNGNGSRKCFQNTNPDGKKPSKNNEQNDPRSMLVSPTFEVYTMYYSF